jgi:hypothetical protein
VRNSENLFGAFSSSQIARLPSTAGKMKDEEKERGVLPLVDPSRRPKAGKHGRFCTLKPSHGTSQAVPSATADGDRKPEAGAKVGKQ